MKFQIFMTFQVFHDLYERIFSLTPISWSCSGNIGETRSSRPTKANRAVMSKGGVTDTELGSGSNSSRRSRVLSRVFEGQKLPPPKKRKLYFVISTVNYIRKIIQTRRGQCTQCKFSQNALDCISAHIHFKKFPEGHAPGPPRKLVVFGHSGLLPQTINPRQNPEKLSLFSHPITYQKNEPEGTKTFLYSLLVRP